MELDFYSPCTPSWQGYVGSETNLFELKTP